MRFSLIIFSLIATLISSSNSFATTHACSRNDNARQCMVCNCFFEAGGENDAGKMGVDIVVIARANAADEPGAYCKVIYAHSQFSWTGDDKSNSVNTGTKSYRDCEATVDSAMTYFSKATNPMYYYANRGTNAIPKPKWARNGILRQGPQLGNQIFYNDPSQPIIKSTPWLNNLTSQVKSWIPSTSSMFGGGTKQ